MHTIHISVSGRLSDVFRLTAVTREESVVLTSGFHQSITHSLVSLETNIHVCDIIRSSVTCKSTRSVGNEILDTQMNYRMLYFSRMNYQTAMKLCGIVPYRLDGSFRYFAECKV